MFTLLRRIRHSLIEANSIRKYVLYALGEISLVVIGILIALQINNWNEWRKSRVLEKEVLQQLGSELNSDIKTLEENIGRVSLSLTKSERIMHHLRNSNVYPDSILADFDVLSRAWSFRVNTSAIKTLESRGIELITNQNLRNQILELYSRWYPWIEGIHDNFVSNLEQVFRPLLRTRFIYPEEMGSMGLEPVNFTELKDDLEFNNAVKVAKSNYSAMLERYEIAMEAARLIVVEIEREYD